MGRRARPCESWHQKGQADANYSWGAHSVIAGLVQPLYKTRWLMVSVLVARVIMGLRAVKWPNSLMSNNGKSKDYTAVESIRCATGDSKIGLSASLWRGNRIFFYIFFFSILGLKMVKMLKASNGDSFKTFWPHRFTLTTGHKFDCPCVKNNRNTLQRLRRDGKHCNNIESNQTSRTSLHADTLVLQLCVRQVFIKVAE